MRVGSAVVALAYCLAFVVVCLGTCLAATDEHGCCPEAEGVTITEASVSIACCQVASGVCSKVTTSAHAVASATTWLSQPTSFAGATPHPAAAVVVASSPPLVLRI